MTDTILANATLVMPTETLRGQVRLSGGRIAEIAEDVTTVRAGDLIWARRW